MVENVVTGSPLGDPWGISFGVNAHTKVYWADFFENTIRRMNSDGSGVELLVPNAGGPTDLALDFKRGYVYWCATATNAVMRADLEKGELSLPAVLAGTDEVAIAAFGFRCEPPLSRLSVAAGETAEARFELLPQGTIKAMARAKYDPRRPVAIDRVLLRGPGGIERVLRRRDDVDTAAPYAYELAQEDGLFGDRFVFARLDRGTYEITVEAQGFEVDDQTVEVELRRDQHLRLGLRPSAE